MVLGGREYDAAEFDVAAEESVPGGFCPRGMQGIRRGLRISTRFWGPLRCVCLQQEQRRVRLFLLHQVLDEKKQKWCVAVSLWRNAVVMLTRRTLKVYFFFKRRSPHRSGPIEPPPPHIQTIRYRGLVPTLPPPTLSSTSGGLPPEEANTYVQPEVPTGKIVQPPFPPSPPPPPVLNLV